MKIGKKIISKNSLPFLIAEVGINHNGNLNNAYRLIDYAVEAKFDAVKFQTINVEKLMIKNAPLAEYQRTNKLKNMNELIHKYNLKYSDFVKIQKYCSKKNIIFLSTPFDIDSAVFLNKLKVPAFKISSSDNDNIFLIDTIKKFNKPLIISSGMTKFHELKKIINRVKIEKKRLAILHCTSDYPTEIKYSMLGAIDQIKNLGYPIGFSDHTIGSTAAVSAVTKGCSIIEKHITLDKDMEGPDHKASLECKDLQKFVNIICDVKMSLISKRNHLTNKEVSTKKIAKKALYFAKNFKKNHIIKNKDLVALRPFQNGISPINYKDFIRKKLKVSVKSETLVKKNKFYSI
ncbi:N-acetylneuraminate synthase family protein [Candidatus Pelagibacter sp. HIMB1321]|uniref:N-acetylneuraminate synthase family protein n=1 Tax=Candidatus Pelagibacter sp. HIMB1321 TaxID=1388755 RepID=UPI000A07F16F|nr:N-acetylneuraminate synthase family protein [Candidatus Pelagibacter sp. HIMB1321]SMF79620.1 N-acetylneuraminate synthase [Candidatus Pelagibacter sp. HIMB1321]